MDPKKEYYKNVAESIIKNLEKRQIDGFYCDTKEDALKKALELIPKGASIGWGGSETMKEVGLMDAIKNGDYVLFDRNATKTPEERKENFCKICGAEWFLMSTNAITLAGELVNVDGTGNRVSFLCFGPDNVLIIAGMNKVTTTLDEAIARARNMAAPPNCVRLSKKTPCAVTGVCADCQSPDCICDQTVITRRSWTKGRIKIILVGEQLGY